METPFTRAPPKGTSPKRIPRAHFTGKASFHSMFVGRVTKLNPEFIHLVVQSAGLPEEKQLLAEIAGRRSQKRKAQKEVERRASKGRKIRYRRGWASQGRRGAAGIRFPFFKPGAGFLAFVVFLGVGFPTSNQSAPKIGHLFLSLGGGGKTVAPTLLVSQ